jgi:broad specificity phosphatase PhoE
MNENKFPLIVTHKHTARVLMKHLLKIKDEDFEDYEIPSKKIKIANKIWVRNIHDRRLPSILVKYGTAIESTIGATNIFKE